jgi:putative ABC transport system permease protein
VSFFRLVFRNLAARKVRTALGALAVAVGVATVVTLGIVTHSLRASATAVLHLGAADFTVAQRDVGDVLGSVIDTSQVRRIEAEPGVAGAVGALGQAVKLDADHPLFLEIGIPPERAAEFGVRVVDGRLFSPTSKDEIMLGHLAAANLGKQVGDTLEINDKRYRVVGIFRTGQDFADAASMFPLVRLQSITRKVGLVTLVFVRTEPRAPLAAVRHRIEHDFPQLVTVRFESEAGLVDRNLELISAADTASTLVALIVGAVIVTNVMLLSFFQRTREFGILRAVGWTRRRVMALVLGEALVLGLLGAAFGVGLSLLATRLLEELPDLVGRLEPQYPADIFVRALYVALGVACLGALYPSLRAALLKPLEAIRHE